MQLFSYLKGLFHRITRGQIKASCDAVIESLQKHTLPAFAQAVTCFKQHKLSSKEAKDFIAEYHKVVGTPKGGQTILDSMKAILENTVELLGKISDRSDTVFSDIESTLGMSFQKATYLRLISSATFADSYARQFLNYLYIVETSKIDSGSSSLQDSITPAERSWVEDNYSNFCLVLAILSSNVQDVMMQVDELPDVIVSEQSESGMVGSRGLKSVDPLGFHGLMMPNISIKWNPFYLLATIRADWRAAQYKAAKEELDLLQMRKLNLEKIASKQPDARLGQQIEYMGSRVSQLHYQVQEMEKKYG